MNSIPLIINHLYNISKKGIKKNDLKLLISVYYYTVSIFDYSGAKTKFKSFDEEWDSIYNKYIKDGYYSYTPEELYTTFESSLNSSGLSISPKAKSLLISNKENFIKTIENSNMSQPRVYGRVAALYERTTAKNYKYAH